MRTLTRTRGRGIAAAAVAALMFVATACGGDGDGDNTGNPQPSGSANESLFQLLPDDIKQSKRIRVGSDVAYAPVEFFDADGKTVIGIDPDIAAALGQRLGVTFEFQNATFDTLIAGVRSGRFDIIMSAMSDTKERQKQIDFIDYFSAGTSILVKKGNPKNIQTLDDLCGKTVALQRGTTQEEVVKEQQKKCGSNAIKLLTYDKDTDALAQVKQGRADADLNDFPVAAYNAQTSGNGNDFEVVGQQIEAGPYGIGVPKDKTQLRDAIRAALLTIIADGTYDKVLEKWNAQAGALKTAAVNGG